MTLDQIKELTSSAKDNDGVFDALMRSFQEHIQKEYSKGRIKGSDYAEVYLGGLNTVMAQASQYLLSKEQSDAQIQLIQAQVAQAEAQTQLIASQKALTDSQKAQTDAETLNVQEQKFLIQAQVTTQQLQQTKLTSDTQLVDQQKANLVEEKLQTTAQTSLITQQELNAAKELLQLDAQIALTNQQKTKLVSDTALTDKQVLLTQEQITNAATQNIQLTKQNLKIDAEVDLLTQKVKTEMAQIVDVVDTVPVAGSIGKQNALYEAQRAGFDRDAEQKLAKMMVDVYAVELTQDNLTSKPTSLDALNFNSVINKAVSGIGA